MRDSGVKCVPNKAAGSQSARPSKVGAPSCTGKMSQGACAVDCMCWTTQTLHFWRVLEGRRGREKESTYSSFSQVSRGLLNDLGLRQKLTVVFTRAHVT